MERYDSQSISLHIWCYSWLKLGFRAFLGAVIFWVAQRLAKDSAIIKHPEQNLNDNTLNISSIFCSKENFGKPLCFINFCRGCAHWSKERKPTKCLENGLELDIGIPLIQNSRKFGFWKEEIVPAKFLFCLGIYITETWLLLKKELMKVKKRVSSRILMFSRLLTQPINITLICNLLL